MRKGIAIFCFLFFLSFFISSMAAAETLEELKARLREEVRRDMGVTNVPQQPAQMQSAQVSDQTRQKQPGPLSGIMSSMKDEKTLFLIVSGAAIVFVIMIYIMTAFRRKKKIEQKDFSATIIGSEPDIKRYDRVETEKIVTKSEKAGTATEIYDHIERLAGLRDKKIISEEEFKTKRDELLSRI